MKSKFYVRFISIILTFALFIVNLQAQNTNNDIEMADMMRSNGKIYVVVTVLVVMFTTLAAYLFSIDRRIKKIERDKELKN